MKVAMDDVERAAITFSRSRRARYLPSFITGALFGFGMAIMCLYVSYTSTTRPANYGSVEMIRSRIAHMKSPYGTAEKDEDNEVHDVYKVLHAHSVKYEKDLYDEVRVLCWVMTTPENHGKKARHVKATWGRRCNKLVFMSSKEDPDLGAIALKVDAEDRDHLWQKTKLAFDYVHKHFRDEADWFLKADDDTYVILENLRYLLKDYNTSEAIYFGHKFKMFVKQGYMSGGAGYVLSKEAVDRFYNTGLQVCRQDSGGAEDIEMGFCMEMLGAVAGNSRDMFGSERFFPMDLYSHLAPNGIPKDSWFWEYTFYKQNEGMDCCSDSVISFHYINPPTMYILDFLLYHARPYGMTNHWEGNDTGPTQFPGE